MASHAPRKVQTVTELRAQEEEEKRKAEEASAARVYEDFITSFAGGETAGNKMFVRGGTISADGRGLQVEHDHQQAGRVYVPQQHVHRSSRHSFDPDAGSDMRRRKGSKRNLDVFMEQLKREQKVQEAVKRIRPRLPEVSPPSSRFVPPPTNKYQDQVGERMLMEMFGAFGAIASVKIMRPRGDEQRTREHNSAFIAFMRREDAMRAMHSLNGTNLMGMRIHVGFGRPVMLPALPIYVPSAHKAYHMDVPIRVTVELPADSTDQRRIDAFAWKVAHQKDPEAWEKQTLREEARNPKYRFLIERGSDLNNYYRWRVYSYRKGERDEAWSDAPFQIVLGGPWWKPPSKEKRAEQPVDEELDDILDEFEVMLRDVVADRFVIERAMGFAFDNTKYARELVDMLADSLTLDETPISKKMARFYLVHDILHNSSGRVKNASLFRSFLQERLCEVFESLGRAIRRIPGRITSETKKKDVLRVLKLWEEWSAFTDAELVEMNASFRKGFVIVEKKNEVIQVTEEVVEKVKEEKEEEEEDIDGIPMDPNNPLFLELQRQQIMAAVKKE